MGTVVAGAIGADASQGLEDPALAAGAPLHGLAERWPVFLGLSGLARFAFAGDHDVPDTEVVQGAVDAVLAVATIGGGVVACGRCA